MGLCLSEFRCIINTLKILNKKHLKCIFHISVYICGDPLKEVGNNHFPDSIPATEKRTRPTKPCVVCRKKTNNSGKKTRRESRYYCPECGVALCVTPCFKIFHTAYNS